MDNRMCLLWLTLKRSIGRKVIDTLLTAYGSPEAVYNETDYAAKLNLPPKAVKALTDKSLAPAYDVIAKVKAAGAYMITILDPYYPPLLKNIYDPPYILYAKGEWPDWRRFLTIAIVGTRDYSPYGKEVTRRIASGLAEKGAMIVSGLALGNDAFAADAAIRAGGMTAAVLGCGIERIYPPENKELFRAVQEHGVIMTEYPPGAKPLGRHFPVRNRIIAGLSYGVVVTDAPEKSGSLITASHAVDNNRNVYAVPASISEAALRGNNKLLKLGAKPITCAEDILEDYPYFKFDTVPAVRKPQPKAKPDMNKAAQLDLDALNPLARSIVHLLCNGGLHMDEITRALETTSDKIGAELIILEIDGIVAKNSDNKYNIV